MPCERATFGVHCTPLTDPNPGNADMEIHPIESDMTGLASQTEIVQPYILAFKAAQNTYPWLSLLNQCNIPIFYATFLDCAPPCNCLPAVNQSLGQVIALKLVAAKMLAILRSPLLL